MALSNTNKIIIESQNHQGGEDFKDEENKAKCNKETNTYWTSISYPQSFLAWNKHFDLPLATSLLQEDS